MSGLGLMTVVGLVVLAVLVVVFLNVRRKDLLGAIMEKRRSSAKLVSRADYVEGAETIPVALALTDDTFYYENPDLEASFDLNRIDEIEYSNELMTGKNHDESCRVLRLRSHGTTFEFLLDKTECGKWEAALPPKTLGPVARAAV
ncbi:MAG TPA: hypothetical protein VNI54_13385 [Thermoanaerobaculia bacterium]|nr:hypothetical protein [Thermoanaerobaculia bacterium]